MTSDRLSTLHTFEQADEGSKHRFAAGLDDLAIGVLAVDGTRLGAVGSFDLVGADTIDVACTLARRAAAGQWRELTDAGVLLDPATFTTRLAKSRVLVSAGLDIEEPGLGDRFLLGVCGELDDAFADTDIVVNGITCYTMRHSANDRFFAVPLLIPQFGKGVDLDVQLRDRTSVSKARE